MKILCTPSLFHPRVATADHCATAEHLLHLHRHGCAVVAGDDVLGFGGDRGSVPQSRAGGSVDLHCHFDGPPIAALVQHARAGAFKCVAVAHIRRRARPVCRAETDKGCARGQHVGDGVAIGHGPLLNTASV